MKNNIFKYLIIFFSIIVILIVYLSIIGIETDKLNNQIKNKILQTNKSLDLDLKKIKLILDPLNFKIYAKTIGATIYFSKKPLALEFIKTEISLGSLIRKEIYSSNFKIETRSILLNDLIKFIRAINNKPELFILEKIVKKGHIILDFSFNVDDNGKIKNDYEIKGSIKDADINLLNQAKIDNSNFNFNIKKDNYFLSDVKFKLEKINFISKKLNIKKKKNSFLFDGVIKNDQSILNLDILKILSSNIENNKIYDVELNTNNKFSFEIDKKLKVKNIILNSNINILQLKYKKPEIINDYFSIVDESILLKNHKLNLKYKNNNLSVKGEGQIQIEKELDQIKYFINKKDKNLIANTELFLKNITLKKHDLLEIYFPNIKENIFLKNHKIKIDIKNKNFTFSGSGKFKINKDFEEINYFFKKIENKEFFNTKLNLKSTNFKIDNINYQKKDETNLNLVLKGEYKNNNQLNIDSFTLNEEKNKIKITNLSLNNLNQIVKVDQANFDYLDINNKKNNFNIKKVTDDSYLIKGRSFNANSLISNLLKSDNSKENNFFERNLNISINLDEVYLDKLNFVKNLKGKLDIKNNKVTQANILAFFKNNQNISFTISMNDQGEKITTLFSSKAKPLVDRYEFIKGFKDGKEGYLDFSSTKKNGVSNSILIIDNFKVKEIPALAKLLALASLQGIADLLTGEGIRFTDFEMKFTNEKKLMKIKELYAIGPAISILLEGYIEGDELISLRGTLVPATTINRSIASIPLIGNLLIGKKVGEGVFGVSFKVKGHPEYLETNVNPIKTLTPRFITRTLEKIKKN